MTFGSGGGRTAKKCNKLTCENHKPNRADITSLLFSQMNTGNIGYQDPLKLFWMKSKNARQFNTAAHVGMKTNMLSLRCWLYLKSLVLYREHKQTTCHTSWWYRYNLFSESSLDTTLLIPIQMVEGFKGPRLLVVVGISVDIGCCNSNCARSCCDGNSQKQ